MDIKIKRILLTAGGITLTAVAFCFVPKINKRVAISYIRKCGN